MEAMLRKAIVPLIAAAAGIGFGLLVAPGSSPTVTAPGCTKVAAPTGSDSAAGSATEPFRTVGKLASALASGETGCLRTATYQGDLAVASAGITLTAYPGEEATILGRLWVKKGADNVKIVGLNLDGKNAALLPSPTVNGNDDQFIGNDITDENTEICFDVGSDAGYGRAQRTLIQGNRIHDCGKLPSQNQDHGIYVTAADDTRIIDNVIYNNVDRGIQLYPDAQRTVIKGNIIDANGEGIIFSGGSNVASNGNVVSGNAITNSQIRHDVESYWPSGGPIGTGNTVTGNCIHGGKQGAIGSQIGFTASSAANTLLDPGYKDRTAGDFRIAATSPCAAVLAASLAPAGPNGEPPVAQQPPPPPPPPVTTTTVPTTTTIPLPPPPPLPAWQPTVGARTKVTKATSPDVGKLGDVVYVSGDGKRAVLLMDSVTVKPVLVQDVGAP